MNFSNLSLSLTKELPKNIKKSEGIYFTPHNTIQRNIDLLLPYLEDITNILEPSCGSCEYINALKNHNDSWNITGIEKNKKIYESIRNLEDNNLTLVNTNFLNFQTDQKYDLVIGNPPFFVMKKNEVDSSYYPYFDGRPNIFILFIIKSLLLLENDGILSFILPKAFMNSLYYDKTRKYIAENFSIKHIVECNDSYLDTQQQTLILILQKTNDQAYINKNNKQFILNKNNYTIFGTPSNIKKLKILYINSKTLNDLDFDVSVGTVVWNQCKNILTNDDSNTLLIYSSDIHNNQLNVKQYKNKDKKNYIKKDGINGPMLVINRGYGQGTYNFEYCLINMDSKYLIENHLICVKYKYHIDDDDLIEKYENIIESLKSKKTENFIKAYFGNSAINTSELNYILPLYNM